MNTISWEDFARIDMRVGTVLRTEAFPEARRPAYKLLLTLARKSGNAKPVLRSPIYTNQKH